MAARAGQGTEGPGPGSSGGPREVHGSPVQVRRPVSPRYPAAARELGLEGRCTLRLTIDPRGAPTEVVVEDCPAPFAPAAPSAPAAGASSPCGWTGWPCPPPSGSPCASPCAEQPRAPRHSG